MATSLISTGVQFADSTVQTTAAVAGGGSAQIVASGALSDGSKVVINADGTVSVVSATAGPPAVGAAVVFENASVDNVTATYDSTNNRVVIGYRDYGNSFYGTAVVGTVSGGSISFGTPVVFESATVDFIAATYDSTNNKIVIAYSDAGNSNYGTAIVGTVSGTSISFGTAVVFISDTAIYIRATFDSSNARVVIAYAGTGFQRGTASVGVVSGTSISFGSATTFDSSAITDVAISFDSTNVKVVIAYSDTGNSNFGTAIVGTISGTSISFGTGVVFESATTSSISASYDSSNSKTVVSYRDQGNSNYGTAIVGTVSGTSISFGTPVVFETALTFRISSAYDSSLQKTLIAYYDGGNSGYGTLILGAVSGTSISFETPLVFETAAVGEPSVVYDSSNSKPVITYADGGNSSYGTAVVYQNESTNLTSENYIGISDGAYADTATATIQLAGAVDDAQFGLTAGQSYFVQSDGTLSETPDTPSVFAGTAVSSTKLIIKG